MCGGVYYNHDGQDVRIYFPNPKALLPVITKDKKLIYYHGDGVKNKMDIYRWVVGRD